MADNSQALEPVLNYVNASLSYLYHSFLSIPGSSILIRYVRSSYQNDPLRTLLEIILLLFALRTILQSRTRADRAAKNYVQLSESEIDELVDDWVPEPLVAPLSPAEQAQLNALPIISGPAGPKVKLMQSGKTVLNLTSYNFAGLAGNEHIKEQAIGALRKYGVGSCGPPGFYGTIDVHMQLEQDLANFLGSESAIIYSQAFSTASSVIPAFCKRGDIIVADRGVSFALQKGIQISRTTVRWYDHNDLASLEEVLVSVEKEMKKKRAPLTRRFIVSEGVFENDGQMVDLPKLIELKQKFKYRLVLDESISFGSVGRTGRGLTELYNVPATHIDMLVGSMATGLNSAGGFCAGSHVVTEHQRDNGTAFVFSAALPALLAVSASEAIGILRDNPGCLRELVENVRVVRGVLDRLECIEIPSHPASPLIHIYVRNSPATLEVPNGIARKTNKSKPNSLVPADPDVFDIESEERLLQDVVDEALAQGVLISRVKRLRGQEALEPRPSIKIAVTAGLSRKETEKAAGVIRAALLKVLGKRR
ncbi:serine palmitoyltransferase [Dacryopinax primogenitus]|uniref:serine C-palmitoyltransferase n=1 Tax=Dacryopinax primogenitus (strain DJM 731) TaxID=1858805 RepID=M5FZY0_DACPD|nr:serine palmitoyltransferase [Dacryopinax primogenitus]EJU01455.1 serine palmitoyltransferase [Dacryopinax primogenitus]